MNNKDYGECLIKIKELRDKLYNLRLNEFYSKNDNNLLVTIKNQIIELKKEMARTKVKIVQYELDNNIERGNNNDKYKGK